ncbi:MAG: TIR domain-containing protein, partial [Anaerolineales bacterium]|nr:TIR domain-containing protein [Anaerolineales bacterium]
FPLLHIIRERNDMSLSSIRSSIESTQREIQRLQKRHSDKSRDVASRSKRITDLKSSLSRTSSTSLAQNKLRQIQSLEKDIAKLQSDMSSLDAQIAKKTEKLHKLQNDLTKEQQREQNKVIKALEKHQQQNLTNQAAVVANANERIAKTTTVTVDFDVFISHASEDKDDLVRPLADALVEMGIKVWYDEFQLKIGDSLRRSIDAGLANSTFGIVVLSPSFFAKNWPQYELDGLVQREMEGGKVILPLWHKVSKSEVMGYSPSLADKLALNSTVATIEELAAEFADVIKGA